MNERIRYSSILLSLVTSPALVLTLFMEFSVFLRASGEGIGLRLALARIPARPALTW